MGYRGEIYLKFKPTAAFVEPDTIKFPTKSEFVDYCVGDRVGQLIIIPSLDVSYTEVDELTNSDRGTGGFGSTGIM